MNNSSLIIGLALRYRNHTIACAGVVYSTQDTVVLEHAITHAKPLHGGLGSRQRVRLYADVLDTLLAIHPVGLVMVNDYGTYYGNQRGPVVALQRKYPYIMFVSVVDSFIPACGIVPHIISDAVRHRTSTASGQRQGVNFGNTRLLGRIIPGREAYSRPCIVGVGSIKNSTSEILHNLTDIVTAYSTPTTPLGLPLAKAIAVCRGILLGVAAAQTHDRCCNQT